MKPAVTESAGMNDDEYRDARAQDVRRLNRWVPRLIFTAAAAHALVGVIASHQQWRDIIRNGLWNAVANDDYARMTALWFMLSGIAFVGIGFLARRLTIATGTTPPEVGWTMLVLGVPMALLEPISGGWFLIAIGVLALLVSRRDHWPRA